MRELGVMILKGVGIDPFDSLGYLEMETSKTRDRQLSQDGLADKLVRKLEPGFRVLSGRTDQANLVRIVKAIQQLIRLRAERREKYLAMGRKGLN